MHTLKTHTLLLVQGISHVAKYSDIYIRQIIQCGLQIDVQDISAPLEKKNNTHKTALSEARELHQYW